MTNFDERGCNWIHCRDMGADCDFVARGENLNEVLAAGAEHGKAVHGIMDRVQQVVRSVTPSRPPATLSR